MYGPEIDVWLATRIPVSETLVRCLDMTAPGWETQRVTVLDHLAGALHLPGDRLGQVGYDILDRMLKPLGLSLETGPGHWVADVEASRHRRIVDEAIDGLTGGEMIDGLVQFGWGTHLIKETPVSALHGLLRDLLARKLGQRLLEAMNAWRSSGRWRAGRLR